VCLTASAPLYETADAEPLPAVRFYFTVPVFGINSVTGQFSLISGSQCRLAQLVKNWSCLFVCIVLLQLTAFMFYLRRTGTQ
jgi:hypothetical protein